MLHLMDGNIYFFCSSCFEGLSFDKLTGQESTKKHSAVQTQSLLDKSFHGFYRQVTDKRVYVRDNRVNTATFGRIVSG
jgi:hypothetical protein